MGSMMVINGRKLIQWVVVLALIVAAGYWIWSNGTAVPATVSNVSDDMKTFEMVAIEYKGTDPETGKELEVYRWNPGMLVVHQGDLVRLNITGINGEGHPFIIEGTPVKGDVTPGKVTTVEFEAKEKGTFRIVCLTHTDLSNEGPMVGYLVVL